MYGKIQRDAVYKARLLDFICQEYALNAISFTEAKRGFYGETWQLETLDRRYFVKLDYSSLHKSVFRDSIAIVEHLCRNGINALQQNGIEYVLKPDRLAFYCYHNFFLYLIEYLTAFYDLPKMRSALLEGIAEYFDGWIIENLQYAGGIR